jgi:hypothetical protein
MKLCQLQDQKSHSLKMPSLGKINRFLLKFTDFLHKTCKDFQLKSCKIHVLKLLSKCNNYTHHNKAIQSVLFSIAVLNT